MWWRTGGPSLPRAAETGRADSQLEYVSGNQDPAAYQELRLALIIAQQGLCAYCEITFTTSP